MAHGNVVANLRVVIWEKGVLVLEHGLGMLLISESKHDAEPTDC